MAQPIAIIGWEELPHKDRCQRIVAVLNLRGSVLELICDGYLVNLGI